jgi:hypothetical protein
MNMRKHLLILAVLAVPTPSHASYTECVALKEITLATRPGGDTEPRWSPVEKGNAVAIRDVYRDWVFVIHHNTYGEGDSKTVETQYGWLPRKAISGCRQMDGTP